MTGEWVLDLAHFEPASQNGILDDETLQIHDIVIPTAGPLLMSDTNTCLAFRVTENLLDHFAPIKSVRINLFLILLRIKAPIREQLSEMSEAELTAAYDSICEYLNQPTTIQTIRERCVTGTTAPVLNVKKLLEQTIPNVFHLNLND